MMQWIWLIPSLGYGIYLFATTGQPYGLIFGGMSAVAVLANGLLSGRKESVDLQAPVHFGRGRIAIGNRILPRAQWLWKPEWVTKVYSTLERENDLHQARLAIQKRTEGSLAAQQIIEHELSAWLGFVGDSSLELGLASEGAHALIAGATGSGKSQLLTTWLVSLCQGYSTNQLRLCLFDFKGGATLSPFSMLPWAAAFVTDLEGDPIHSLEEVVEEMRRRERLLASHGVSRVRDLPQQPQVPTLLIVIDELQALTANLKSHSYLEAVAARGRSLGVHLIATSQSLAGMPRGLMANLSCRILVGKPDPIDLAQIGYSRQSATIAKEPLRTATGDAAFTQSHEWGKGVLVSPQRQVEFTFPSAGRANVKLLS